MTYAPGQIIAGKYEVLALIAEGGFGAVYRVRHRFFDIVLALKVLKLVPGLDVDQLAHAMIAEAKLLYRLSHQNIIELRDIEIGMEGLPMIAMEFIDGESLRSYRQRAGGPLPLAAAVDIVAQVCDALIYAHERGVVHRDIKPSNIMVRPLDNGGCDVTVIDFSIASVREDAALAADPGAIQFLGTAAYISPEQAEGRKGADLDGRSDLYALAMVLYELLTGRLPFDGSEAVIAYQRLFIPAAPPTVYNPGIPQAVCDVILRALHRDREQRYAGVAEFKEALLGALQPVSDSMEEGPPIELLAHAETAAGPENGDYYLLGKEIGLYLVATGKGEQMHTSARVAAHAAAEVVYRAMQEGQQFRGDYLLLGALEEANRRVRQQDSQALASLTVVLDGGHVLYIASVGETRAYRFVNAHFEQITDDQTWQAEIGRRLGLSDSQRIPQPFRRVLTMAIGMDEFRVNYYLVEKQRGMKILLTSPGVHHVLSHEALWECVALPFDLEVIGERIIAQAREAGGQESMTAVLLKAV